MAAPLAAFIRFKAIDPEASTIKIMSDPAFRAIRFARTSPPSMNTPLPSLEVPCHASTGVESEIGVSPDPMGL